MELYASFNYNFNSFGYWLQQLFTESEGKEGKGLFVCPVAYSTDLHSVGQFVQDGTPILAETFIDVKNPIKDTNFTNIALDNPLKFLDGKTMSEVNRAAYEGTVQAHIEAKVPIVSIEVDEDMYVIIDAFNKDMLDMSVWDYFDEVVKGENYLTDIELVEDIKGNTFFKFNINKDVNE